ncbi:unnamed protein product, partial [Citrullus colocynthis]
CKSLLHFAADRAIQNFLPCHSNSLIVVIWSSSLSLFEAIRRRRSKPFVVIVWSHSSSLFVANTRCYRRLMPTLVVVV